MNEHGYWTDGEYGRGGGEYVIVDDQPTRNFTFRVTHNGAERGTVQAHNAADALDEWFGCDDFHTEPDETPQRASIVLHDGTYTAEWVRTA